MAGPFTASQWVLLAFVTAPLALCVLGSVLRAMSRGGPCRACGHRRRQHGGGVCAATVHAYDGKPSGAGPCGCPRYEEPPYEEPPPIGCGG